MIKRKDGRYQDQTTIDGKRVYFYGKTEPEVKRKMAAYNKKQEKGLTFSEAAEEWEGVHRERITPNAWQVYAAPIRRAREHFKGYLRDIKPSQIQAYITSIAKYGYARRTVQSYLDMLRMIFDYAVVSGYVDTNPCLSVRMPSGLKSNTRALPDDITIDKIKASVNVPFGLFAFCALYTGLRRGELLALRYEDIDRIAKSITVKSSVYYRSNQPLIKSPKTKAGYRNVILLDALADKLDMDNKGYIFGGEKPLTKSEFRRRWEGYIKRIGIDITPHQLRHYYATMLYEAGVQDKDAQLLLGHSNIQTTKDIYTHIRDSRQTETAAKLNAFVNSLSKTT